MAKGLGALKLTNIVAVGAIAVLAAMAILPAAPAIIFGGFIVLMSMGGSK